MSLPQPFNLDSKVAVVTGAASGLGIAFAEAMADVVCADIDEDVLGETADKVVQLQCAVSKEDDVKAMVEKTTQHFGRLDILFNKALWQVFDGRGGRLGGIASLGRSKWYLSEGD